jgi:hypothetical protein
MFISCGVVVAPASEPSPLNEKHSLPSFPLQVSASGRYLVDQKQMPFFINGDSPWEILWRLSKEEAKAYLETRQQQGFNAILVDVLPFTERRDPSKQANRDGQFPFETPGDFSTPNEKYFAHLDWLVRTAADKGFLVMLVPCDLGAGNPGMWYPFVKQNGVAKCYRYGKYLGNRYRNYPNILWVLGGDRDPGDVTEHVRAIAQGLKEAAPNQLRTYHPSGGKLNSSAVFFHEEDWLDINLAYTPGATYIPTYQNYRRTPIKPTFLAESAYEGERRGWVDEKQPVLVGQERELVKPQRVRRQAYWAMLAGSCGHMYGSRLWDFPVGWKNDMDMPGARHMRHLRQLFESYPWFRLVPDHEHQIVIDGYESGPTLATTAALPDGSLAITYLPSKRTITVALNQFKGPVMAKWMDPTSGVFTLLGKAPLANTGRRPFTPPERNADGDADFILVLEIAR